MSYATHDNYIGELVMPVVNGKKIPYGNKKGNSKAPKPFAKKTANGNGAGKKKKTGK